MDNNYMIHASHCCKWHGCKYGDTNCPVVLHKVKQIYLCEHCYDYLHDENYYRQVIREIDEIKQFKLEEQPL